jgi:hypothetical protein
MKNQYHGDARDHQKYSLLLDLVADYSQLTNILLLTPDDHTREGGKRNYSCTSSRADLWEFLQASKNIGSLRRFFRGRGFTYHHYDKQFSHESRRDYFSAIPSGWLRDALVFLDPDIGMEDDRAYSRRNGPTKYVFYPEIAKLWQRMEDSCLVIYQHLIPDKTKQTKQLTEKVKRLREVVLVPIKAVRRGDLAFLIGYAKGQQK